MLLPKAADSDATDARFGLRAVLKIMAVIAVVAAVLGPIVRQFDPDEQRRLLTAWALWLAGAVVWIGSQAQRRFEAERRAGRAIIRLSMPNEGSPDMTVVRPYVNGSTAFLLAIAGLALVGMVALDPPSARTPGSTILLYASCGVASIGLLSQGVFRLWWQKSIRLCESGVLWDRTLLYWTHVTGHRWSASGVLELRAPIRTVPRPRSRSPSHQKAGIQSSNWWKPNGHGPGRIDHAWPLPPMSRAPEGSRWGV